MHTKTKENTNDERLNERTKINTQTIRFANPFFKTGYVQIIPTNVKGAKPNWLDKCNAIISEIIIALGRIIRRYQ